MPIFKNPFSVYSYIVYEVLWTCEVSNHHSFDCTYVDQLVGIFYFMYVHESMYFKYIDVAT